MTNSIDKLAQNIAAVHGKPAIQWWQNLSTSLQQLSKQLHIKLSEPFADLSFHYVAPATGPQGQHWVLKYGIASDTLRNEAQALQHYQGNGAVALIDADLDAGWLLLERCTPGTPLIHHHQEHDTIPIAVKIMQQLWHHTPQPDQHPHISHWFTKLNTLRRTDLVNTYVPEQLQDFADDHATTLLQQSYRTVLLHGDLHYQNIVNHQDQWVAIDPKGVIGPSEIEPASFIRNPQCVLTDTTQEHRAISRNIDQILELTQFDRHTMISWAIVQAVLWVYWYLEDNLAHEAKPVVQFAQQLYKLLP